MSESKSSPRLLRVGIQLGLLGALVAGVACTEKRTDLGGDPDPVPAFVDPDAGAGSDANELRAYCASDRCPSGHTTCAGSTFLCDVDLLTNIDNCGECGNACPQGSGNEEYACNEGRCVMTCNVTQALDCDGVPDNGCEAKPWDSSSCGTCGVKCAAGEPCIDRGIMDYGCGCRPGELNCGSPILPCIDPEHDDQNCGACHNACPREGDGSERPPKTYFGCYERECGVLKCEGGYGDCDGIRDNGCEEVLLSNDHCGACGNKCQAGMFCAIGRFGIPECMCPSGLTFCGSCSDGVCFGYCADLASERENCGACGSACSYSGRNTTEACVYGKCQRSCKSGWGDCNGNPDDGCETNIGADPKNCGACGKICDAIAGQACVDGQCMVEPCDLLQDAGGTAR